MAALATALILSGCTGGDDEDESSSPTTSAAQVTTAAPRRVAGGPFCEFLVTFNDRFGRVGADATSPEQLKATFEQAAQAIQDAEPLAPPEIRSDVGLLATTFRDFVGVLQQVDYDFTKVPPAAIQNVSRPEVDAAGERVDSYIRQNCRTA